MRARRREPRERSLCITAHRALPWFAAHRSESTLHFPQGFTDSIGSLGVRGCCEPEQRARQMLQVAELRVQATPGHLFQLFVCLFAAAGERRIRRWPDAVARCRIVARQTDSV